MDVRFQNVRLACVILSLVVCILPIEGWSCVEMLCFCWLHSKQKTKESLHFVIVYFHSFLLTQNLEALWVSCRMYLLGLGFTSTRKLQKLSRELYHCQLEACECALLWWLCWGNWINIGLHGKEINF